VTFAPLIVLAIAIGVYPKPLFQILEQPVNGIVAAARPDYPLQAQPTVNAEEKKKEPVPAVEPTAAPVEKKAEPLKTGEATARAPQKIAALAENGK
jgi:triacylglycerol esterase/lipase EstA (alpha/beta hydrolase family)